METIEQRFGDQDYQKSTEQKFTFSSSAGSWLNICPHQVLPRLQIIYITSPNLDPSLGTQMFPSLSLVLWRMINLYKAGLQREQQEVNACMPASMCVGWEVGFASFWDLNSAWADSTLLKQADRKNTCSSAFFLSLEICSLCYSLLQERLFLEASKQPMFTRLRQVGWEQLGQREREPRHIQPGLLQMKFDLRSE